MINPLELNAIMADSEIAAVKQYIRYHLKEEMARLALAEAKADLAQAAKELNVACFAVDDDGPIGTIPGRFIVQFQDSLYLVEIDEEEGKYHTVTSISGILR